VVDLGGGGKALCMGNAGTMSGLGAGSRRGHAGVKSPYFRRPDNRPTEVKITFVGCL
jgi:hypothetical protein